MKERVLVLDFGSQFTQLITRRVRELGVYSEILPCTKSVSDYDTSGLKAIILSGGPASVTAEDAPRFDESWLKLGIPVLGVCYGMQLMAHVLGGRVAHGSSGEYGYATVSVLNNSDLFCGFSLDERLTVWMSHQDRVEKIPSGFIPLGESGGAPFAGMGDPKKKLYAIQFHPEVVHTPRGKEILANFLFKIASCSNTWTTEDFIEQATAQINQAVEPGKNVICGLSGGVDSTVAAVLVHRALGERLQCIFVDNGLLRKDEGRKVMERLGSHGLGLKIHLIDAADKFLKELRGITEPEQKRKVIGRVFIEVFDAEAKKISNVTHLVQGTLYPDVIESVSVRGPSATIKTHHNVGGLPDKMKLKLIEPFRELFKDEVRTLGDQLGLPKEIIQRQPFPGPGLAVRVLGEVTSERLETLREADNIFLEEIRAENLYESLWQSFAVLLPVKSVGVMGDFRTYEQTVALRAVHSEDGMTADWSYLPQELLRRVSNRIINEVKGVNRVVLDISSKPPSTIEWE